MTFPSATWFAEWHERPRVIPVSNDIRAFSIGGISASAK
jgi:hypothetical protein